MRDSGVLACKEEILLGAQRPRHLLVVLNEHFRARRRVAAPRKSIGAPPRYNGLDRFRWYSRCPEDASQHFGCFLDKLLVARVLRIKSCIARHQRDKGWEA